MKEIDTYIKKIELSLDDIEKEANFLRMTIKEMYIKNKDLLEKLNGRRK